MLQGFKVVELATHIAAPAAGGMLADWGAAVVKIESREGDPMRWLRATAPGGCTPVFETNNRGKRCICVDFGKPEGREVILRLVQDADVFLTNLRPGGLKRAGLDWATLHALNPRLVYASVTGYGLRGADADTPAFDGAAFWSRSGMADLVRPDGADPFSLRQGSGDHTCALTTALGIVTALLARERSGEGRLVETSLLRSAVYVLGADFANQMRMGTVTRTQPRAAATNPINNFFQSSEGRWIFVMPRSRSPSDFAKICQAVGAGALAADPRFETPEARLENSAALVTALDAAFAATAFDAIAEALTASDVVWSPVQTPLDVLADPQAQAAGCFTEMSDGAGGVFRSPNTPVRFEGEDVAPKRPVGRLGQHTDELLAELGYGLETIAAMRTQDAVG